MPGAAAEKWGGVGAAFEGPDEGNPYTDVELSAEYRRGNRQVEVTGFHDGGGTYRGRCRIDLLGRPYIALRAQAVEG